MSTIAEYFGKQLDVSHLKLSTVCRIKATDTDGRFAKIITICITDEQAKHMIDELQAFRKDVEQKNRWIADAPE